MLNDAPLIVQQKESHSRIFQGIIPHPDTLKAYADLIPDAPERLLRKAEREGEIRHRILEKMTRDSHREVMFGIAAAIIISLAVVGFGVYCIHKDYPVLGLAVVAVDLISILVALFRRPEKRSGRDAD